MPRTFIIKEETKALGAAQIMIGLIITALGILWTFLHQLEDTQFSVGDTLMKMITIYTLLSALFIVLAIVMNIISIIVAMIGILIVLIEFPAFESEGQHYSWSNMVGMILLHYSALVIISELIIACIMISWFRSAFRHEIREESPCSEEPSQLEFSSLDESELYCRTQIQNKTLK